MVSNLIDRKTVFDVIDKCILEKLEGDTVEIKEPLKLITKIYRIPSAQPQRKTGKWVSNGVEAFGVVEYWVCDQCYAQSKYRSNFCPSCGADMDGENDA